jgi:hypothetical protein
MTTYKKSQVRSGMLKLMICFSISISFLLAHAADSQKVELQSGSPASSSTSCKAHPRFSNDGPDAIEYYTVMVSGYFLSNANLVNLLVNDWVSADCVMDDGRPRLAALTAGYRALYTRHPDWQKNLVQLEAIKKQFPKKAFVAVAEVEYWIDYAWDARGEGYASSVTPEGWKFFKQRLEKAEITLIATKSYAAELPIWYDQMMIVQSALDRPDDERNKTFIEGAKKFKTYYPTYFTMLNYLLPKWGGRWETVDNMVKWSVENTKDVDGDTMYARLYWYAYQSTEDGNSFFKKTPAKWPLMKKGFDDLMLRHPKSKWNLNNYAKFACIAGDKKTYLAVRKQIGNDVMASAWSQSTPLDLCEAKYGRVN